MQSEHVNELYTALSKCQGEIRPAIKDAANPFFKSKYADLSSVWESCREALVKNGLCVTQSIMILDGVNCLVTVLGHRSGQWIKSVAPIICAKPDVQSFGSAVTYQRRYALSAIVGVSTEDDDGESAIDRSRKAPEAPKAVPVERISSPEAQMLRLQIEKLKADQQKGMNDWLAKRGYSNISDIPADKYQPILDRANEMIKKNEEEKSPSVNDTEVPF